jgi:hypothetical protein
MFAFCDNLAVKKKEKKNMRKGNELLVMWKELLVCDVSRCCGSPRKKAKGNKYTISCDIAKMPERRRREQQMLFACRSSCLNC